MSFQQLKARVVSGTFLVAGAQLFRQLVQLGAVALLARLVAPADFGLVALAVGLLAFLQVLADFGLGAALEREKDLAPAVESRLFRLNLLSALAMAGVAMVVAPGIAGWMRQPELAFLLRALAWPFLLAGAVRTRASTLARRMRFGRLSAVEIVPVLLGTAASVILAARGWGVVALVAGAGLQQILWSVSVVLAAGVPCAAPAPLRDVMPLVRFGASHSLFQLINTTARKMDDVLVGGLMGVAALGLYEKSYALMMVPVAYLAGAANRVLYPALAQVRDVPEQFRFLYLGVIRKVAGLSFPAAAFCAAAAGSIVPFVLGPQFEAAVPIFGVLALMIGIQPLLSVSGVVYLAHARMRLYLTASTSASAVLIAGFLVGAASGSPEAMARWYSITYCAVFIPQLHLVLRTADVRWVEFARRAGPSCLSSLAMLATGVATRAFGFAIQSAFMVVVYVGLHLLLDRRALLDLFRFLDPRRVVVRPDARPAGRAPAQSPAAEMELHR